MIKNIFNSKFNIILVLTIFLTALVCVIFINEQMLRYCLGEGSAKHIYAVDMIKNHDVIFICLGSLLLILFFVNSDIATSMTNTIFWIALIYQLYPNRAVFFTLLISGIIWSIIDRDFFIYKSLSYHELSAYLSFIMHIIKAIAYAEVVSSCFVFSMGYERFIDNNKDLLKSNPLVGFLIPIIPWIVVILIELVHTVKFRHYYNERIFILRYYISHAIGIMIVMVRIIAILSAAFLIFTDYGAIKEGNLGLVIFIFMVILSLPFKVLFKDIKHRRFVVPIENAGNPELYFMKFHANVMHNRIMAIKESPTQDSVQSSLN